MAAKLPNRRVHAQNADLAVVRYERAGKWYIEPRNSGLPRQAVSVHEAAQMAVWLHANGGVIIAGVPGGGTFDRLVHGLRPPQSDEPRTEA